MAALQLRNESWRVIFRYKGQQYFVTLGKVEEIDAQGIKARYEYLLRLLKQRIRSLPAGMDVVTFLEHDGKPPDSHPKARRKETTFAQLRDAYLKTFGNGAVEESTLYTAKIHFSHFEETLGKKFPMNSLAPVNLQRHIDRRCTEEIAGVTVKKEIDTLRGAWNWASRMGYVEGDFPSGVLVYPKGDEKPPFMTKQEIERQIAAGGEAAVLWDCLFLTLPEVTAVLAEIKKRAKRPWVCQGTSTSTRLRDTNLYEPIR